MDVVDESSKSPSNDDDKGEIGDAQEPLASNVSSPRSEVGEGQPTQEPRYPSRERRPLGEWWKNHILPQRDVERANVAFVGDPQTLSEAMQSGDAKKWEEAMKTEYDSLMAKGTWELLDYNSGREIIAKQWYTQGMPNNAWSEIRPTPCLWSLFPSKVHCPTNNMG